MARLWGFSRGKAPLSPELVGPPPPGMDGLRASACEDCHVREAAEWRASGHRQSWTRPLFQRAYALEPMPECRNCHQPLSAGRARSRESLALRAEGITCAVCHVRGGAVLAVSRSGRAPHPVREAPLLGSAAFCGGCHQFPFPEHRADGELVFTDEPMQDTLEEWRRHRGAQGDRAQRCQDCHMPRAGGRSGHGFPGGYDRALLASAVTVDGAVRAVEQPVLTLRLRATAQAGHAVPTGDLFRSLVATAELLDSAGHVVGAAAPEVLTRRFMDVAETLPDGRSRLVRRQALDGRLAPGEERVLTMTLRRRVPAVDQAGTASRARPGAPVAVRYRVRLHRLPPGADAAAGPDAMSVVREGVIPLPAAGATQGPQQIIGQLPWKEREKNQ